MKIALIAFILFFSALSLMAQGVENLKPLVQTPCIFSSAPHVSERVSDLVLRKLNSRVSQKCRVHNEKFSDIFSENRIKELAEVDESLIFAFWLGHTNSSSKRYILRLVFLPEALQWSAGFAETSLSDSAASEQLVTQAFDALPFVGYMKNGGFAIWSLDQTGPFSFVEIEGVNRHPFLPQILNVLRKEALDVTAQLKSSSDGKLNLVFDSLLEMNEDRTLWMKAKP